jgi:TetR/AcrR family transcriptional repressor of nem operon
MEYVIHFRSHGLECQFHSGYDVGMPAETSLSARRLTRKGEATRQRIVDAAAKVIFDKGVAQTTIEDVRAAASVSSSQLYHYFADKPALVRAVVDHQADTIADAQRHFDLSTLDGLRAWRDFVVQHAHEVNGRGGCPLGSLGSELAETDPEARAALAAGFERWEAAIGAGLAEMHARGTLDTEADPGALALATLASLQGGLLLAQVQRSTKPLEIALDAIIALIARQSPAEAP